MLFMKSLPSQNPKSAEGPSCFSWSPCQAKIQNQQRAFMLFTKSLPIQKQKAAEEPSCFSGSPRQSKIQNQQKSLHAFHEVPASSTSWAGTSGISWSPRYPLQYFFAKTYKHRFFSGIFSRPSGVFSRLRGGNSRPSYFEVQKYENIDVPPSPSVAFLAPHGWWICASRFG